MRVDLDRLIDYKSAYAGIENAKITGDSLIGLCPFHQDRNASFSVNLTSGLYKCFSCGAEGNYLCYLAHEKGISTKDAYMMILKEKGVSEDGVRVNTKSKQAAAESYCVEDYAKEKGLDAAWLKERWGLRDGTDKKVGDFVSIPYFGEDQQQLCFRKRYPKGASQRFSWSNGAKGKIALYGLWLLEKIREEGYVILCEGESDTQTLWHLGYPALGVPGATTFKAEWADDLAGLKLYLHVEPDQGGQTFRSAMAKKLYQGEFLGEVFSFSCGHSGHKDPSELFLAEGKEKAQVLIRQMLDGAKKMDLEGENAVEVIPGAPKNLQQPEGWIYSERGISIIEERTQQPKCICRTPIILTKRMRNEVGEEKIEVAFRRDGEWNTAIFPRTVIFQSKSITCLAELGATITSENAKQVVAFLQALEAENMETLELVDSTSHCGWQSKERFIPGCGGDLVLDVSPQMQSVAAGYCRNGTFDKWKQGMLEHRQRPFFRAYLAASFGAPLLRILNVRNFILYNWADSGKGKTAALKAALSAWGDPNRLMISCDSTKVALERRASFFCDLPFGIDERQSAGDKQSFLENLTYMLANGVGRARASKEEGGLQNVLNWRTIAIMTGEEPLLQNATKGGASNRTLEIYGGPFDNELQAVNMHQTCDEHCGWAGPEFVQHLISSDQMEIRERYRRWLSDVGVFVGVKKQAHAASIALLAMSDELSSMWIFGEDERTARSNAMKMARALCDATLESDPDDVNDRALQFVQNWVLTNWKNFQGAENAPIYGWLEDDCICIVPSVLRAALEDAKFSSRKSYKAFAEMGVLKIGSDGKVVIPKRNRKAGVLLRVLVFGKEALIGEHRSESDDATVGDILSAKSENFSENEQSEFPILSGDEPLPF